MRRLVVGLLCALAVLSGGGGPAHAADLMPVTVVGVPGLTWSDVDPRTTPNLAALAERSAVGLLSVKAVPTTGCLADAWLTLGAGNRALADGNPHDPCTGQLPTPADLPRLDAANRDLREGAELGAMASALGGACPEAIGPGAELALATAEGRVPQGAPRQPCVLRVVDAGPDLAVADRLIGQLDAARAEEDSGLIVVGLPAADQREPQLHVAMATGWRWPPGTLVSGSTRRTPYVQLVDVAPTVLDALRVQPVDSMIGQVWRSEGRAPSVAELKAAQREATAHRSATVPFFVVLVAAMLLGFAAAAALRSRAIADGTGLIAAAVPGASYLSGLVPWWRVEPPLLGMVAAVAAATALLLSVALLGPWRRWPLGPPGAVCALSALVVLVDLVTGAHLQLHTPAGYSALVAGRFAGLGNVAFGVLAACALLGTAALAAGRSRETALLVVAACGVVTVLVTGAPPWGSDVGGVLALVPGFVLLGLLLTGARVSAARLLLAVGGAVALVALLAVVDLLRRPEDRSHLGRFAADVVNGQGGDLLRRKAEGAVALVTTSPVTALLPVLVALAAWALLRPPRALQALFTRTPAWRAGLLSVGLTALLGLLLNDSGAAVPALALLVAVPAVVSAIAADGERTGTGSAAGESLTRPEAATK